MLLLLLHGDVHLPVQELLLPLQQDGLPLSEPLLLDFLFSLCLHKIHFKIVKFLERKVFDHVVSYLTFIANKTYIFFNPYFLHSVGDLLSPIILHVVETLVWNVGEVGVGDLVQPVDDGLEAGSVVAVELPAVLHQISPFWRTRGRDVEVQLAHGHPVGDGHIVDTLVRRLSSQQLP